MRLLLAFGILFPLLGQAQLVPQVVQQCRKRNVFVQADNGQPTRSEGSGINIGKNRVLSAFHVVGSKRNRVFVDGKPAKILKMWEERDLVLLYAPIDDNTPEVEITDHMPGDEVFLVGNPKSCKNKVMYGSMIGMDKGPIYDPTYKGSVWLSDILGLPGNSGGGLWDKEGHLVGVFKGWEKSGDVSVIIPGSDVRQFLDVTVTAKASSSAAGGM
jgi:S1-C subfamily serine protease